MVHSQRKGAIFERKIAKDISLWLTDGERGDLIRRSIMSGGRYTVAYKKGDDIYRDQAGDLSIAGNDKNVESFLSWFVVELKHYKDLQWDSFIYGKSKTQSVLSFWQKLVKESKKVDKLPFMVVKQNNRDALCILCTDGLYKLHCGDLVNFVSVKYDCCIMKFDDLITTVKWGSL